MATLDESLLYPLILLLVGAGLSVGLGTWLTHWLENRRQKRETEVENHRKELEIKVELASKMSEVIANVFGNAKTTIMLPKRELSEAQGEKVTANFEKWFEEANIIRSKLQSYYGNTDLAKRWFDYWDVVIQYYFASINYFRKAPEPKAAVKAPEPLQAPEESLKDQLKSISDYFSQNVKGEILDKDNKPQKPWENLPMSIEETQWYNVYQAHMAVGDDIIKDVLELPITVF